MDIVFKLGAKQCKPYEYFCNHCGQLRFSKITSDECGNCGSSDIIKGKPMSLDKDVLKAQYLQKTTTHLIHRTSQSGLRGSKNKHSCFPAEREKKRLKG